MKNMPKHILDYNNFKYIFTPEKPNIKKKHATEYVINIKKLNKMNHFEHLVL